MNDQQRDGLGSRPSVRHIWSHLFTPWAPPLGLILIVAAALLGAGLPRQAALAQENVPPKPTSETQPLHLAYDGVLDLLRLPGAAAAAVDTSQPALGPEYASWSKLAFQSARNQHDWEVYGARGDGSDQVNLSNNPSMDIHPQLDRGAARVAFASNQHGKYEVFAMNADGSGLARLTNNSTDDVYPAWSPDGGKIAFQAYRDGQAEIYVMNADGSSQTRITNYGDYDGEPAWSPDGSQIAFTRKGSGEYRIWVMNADGSNPHRLSNQRYSENPAWSPDGSQIAYDADGNGDGWQELWLMDAGGGNQRQVYQPPESYTDAWVRSWSPDGRYVAFTRISFIQQGGTWYWTTAYLDAWDSQNPWTVMRLSSSGDDWNPDWQTADIWAPTSSLQALPAISPGPFFLGWSGTDIGPAGIASYDLQVKEGAVGVWTDWLMGTPNTPEYYPGLGGHTYYFRVRARDNAGNVEPWPADYQAFTTVESAPPVSSVRPLEPFTQIGDATMSWDGYDIGGSNISTFEVQCRDGAAGAWENCGTYSAPGSAAIPGQSGHTIYLRSRATDSAGNVEAWPTGNGDTHTTLYAMKVSGHAWDNGGAPVIGASAVTTPTNFVTEADAPDGSYAAYTTEVSGDGSVDVALSKAEYGVLPATRLEPPSNPPWLDWVFDGYLPPSDNVVRNWGFEDDLLPSWDVGGSAPPLGWDRAGHTGARGVALGWPFTVPENLSHAGGYARLHTAVSDEAGGLHVTWEESDSNGNPVIIRYAHLTAEGAWTDFAALTTTRLSTGSRLAVDSTGALYAAWNENGDVFFRHRTTDGQWSTPINVSNTSGVGSIVQWLGLDGQGSAHAIWLEGHTSEDYQIYYSQRDVNGAWSAPTKVSNAGSYGAHFGSAAAAANGEVEVAWTEWLGGQGGYILSSHRSAGGAWSAPQQLVSGERPQLLADPNSVMHMVFASGAEIRYSSRPPGGEWSAPETVLVPWPGYAVGPVEVAIDQHGAIHFVTIRECGSYGCELIYVSRSPSGAWSPPELAAATPYHSTGIRLAVSAEGTVMVACRTRTHDMYYYHDIAFSRRSPAGGWSTAIAVSDNTTQSVWAMLVVADSNGRGHVLWTNEVPGGTDVFHSLYVGTPPAGDSWLRQQVTILSATVNPGLSFMYRYDQGNPDNGNPFSITVTDGATTNPVFTTTAVTTGWTHRWLDLSAWRGEQITITFDVQNAADNAPAIVYLDEVTVGSTHPDLWTNQSGPPVAPPGTQLVQDITYGNRGGVRASNSRITVQLPPELSFVSAEPPPSATTPDLRWDTGDLVAQSGPETIRVTLQAAPRATPGATVIATAGIASDTAEIEQANNTAQAEVFIGYLVYLPVVTR
jgi:Tol biopolymer transport system component